MANAPETLRRIHSYRSHISRYRRQLEILEANIEVLRKWGEQARVFRAALQEREKMLEKITKTQTILEVLQDSLERK
jgi:hypothetical protein